MYSRTSVDQFSLSIHHLLAYFWCLHSNSGQVKMIFSVDTSIENIYYNLEHLLNFKEKEVSAFQQAS